MSVTLNAPIPEFEAQATSDLTVKSSDLQGKNTIIYFYPKDNTPGCTKESEGFRDQFQAFESLNTVIYGVSKDTLKSHEKFKEKLSLPFELISDPDESFCTLFGVIREKSMYGRLFMGIERSTFLIDEQGTLQCEWRKVKVKGHVEAVLKATQLLVSGRA